MPEILLICMPFAAVERPSIAIGTLQSILAREGFETECVYANIAFCDEIGHAAYRFWEDALGDLVFATAAFPDYEPDLSTYLRGQFARKKGEAALYGIASTFKEFETAAHLVRCQAKRFVHDLAETVTEKLPRIIGCTSMYWQHTASLGLLRRVRELALSTITMLGGANCEGVMGLATHRNFPFVDFVVSGDADDLISPLCTQLLRENRHPSTVNVHPAIFGPLQRRAKYALLPQGFATPRAEVKNLDAVPVPSFGDYFRALQESSTGPRIRPGLLMETARGCWYGQVHQCKFCGISEGGMKFNMKSPERVLGEFDQLENLYRTSDFEVTDNIMSMSFFGSVLPRLANRPERLKIFWETKANLKRSQVKLLAESGVSWIQPGIESLDSRVLKLMDKGVQASQNIQLLRWCREDGVRVAWNLLWGLPGESDSWYGEIANLIPLLHHLQPPRIVLRMRYDRYSVYHTRARDYGLTLQPMKYMELSYPLPSQELSDLAYYFEAVGENGAKREPLAARPGVVALYKAVAEWKRCFWRGLPPVLSISDDGQALCCLDTRDCAPARKVVLTGIERDTYLACEAMPLRANVSAQDAIETLKERRLILEIDGRLQPLGLTGAIPALPPASAFPGGNVASEPQRRASEAVTRSGLSSDTRVRSSSGRGQRGASIGN
jgi:ribosomal peptide maturation radical SAM protein 1